MFKEIKELPRGARDVIGSECEKINFVINKFNNYFDGFAYEEVITPSFEFKDIFNSVSEEELYKFYDCEGRMLSLKADSTLAIARLVSSKLKDKKLPLRIRYSSKVFRVNKNLSGKKNEVFDAGIEIIGENKENSDIEAIVLGIAVLKNIGFDDFKIEIGHIGIMQKIISMLNLDANKEKKFIELIDGKKLVDLNYFIESLDIASDMSDSLKELPWLFGDIDKITGSTIAKNKELKDYIDYLKLINDKLTSLGFAKYLSFDLGVASKIDYYSGIVFKAYINGASNDILQGGRYDNLMNSYGRELGAIGFSLRVDDIAGLICEKSLPSKEALKLSYNDENYFEILKDAIKLRESGEEVSLVKEEI